MVNLCGPTGTVFAEGVDFSRRLVSVCVCVCLCARKYVIRKKEECLQAVRMYKKIKGKEDGGKTTTAYKPFPLL